MFEWSCDTCVWSGNKAAEELYGEYDIDIELLPISDFLKKKLNYLVDNFEDTYDWVLLCSTGHKDEDKIMEFEAKALIAYRMLYIELGLEYTVERC